jgi:hypothetical protein
MSWFINISNHPFSKWKKEQQDAAYNIAARIIDFPFPEVPPEADSVHIAAMADQIVDQLKELIINGNLEIWKHTYGIMIQGEPTLTAALVRRLQLEGKRWVYAPITQRVIKTNAKGRQVSTFRFVGFRLYPDLTS